MRTLGTAVLGIFLSGVPNQTAKEQDAIRLEKLLQHEVSVTLKLIQVFVSDKQGKPVEDLTKDDFIVRDNGVEVSLTEFEKHVLSAPSLTNQELLAQEARERVVADQTPPPSIMNRKFFLFIDFANNNAKGIAKSKEAALHFVKTDLVPGDQVGLVSYSMLKGLSIHEYLTADAFQIAEAITDLSVKEIAGRVEDFEHEYWGKATTINESPYAKSRFQLEAERKESKYQVQNYIGRLADLAKALRYVPGKKSIVLFSTGVVTSLIYYGQAGQPTSRMGAMANKVDAGDYVLRSAYEDMMKEMAASDCSIFSFDTREAAMVGALFDADSQSYEDGQRNITSVEGARKPQNVFKDEKTTGFYALSRLSSSTGGKYFANIEDYKKNLSDVGEMTRAFYVLGFPVLEQEDGKFHDIKVEVKRKGCEVRAPAGYFNPKPFTEYSNIEKQLHLFDLALSEKPLLQTPLTFAMTSLTYYANGSQQICMLSKIPVDVMERFAGRRLELISLAFDEKESVSAFDRIEVDLTKYRGMDVFWMSGTVLRPGSYKCRLVIRDLENGRGAIASCRTAVPNTKNAGIGVHSPLFLLPGSDFVYLGTEKASSVAAEWRKYYPYEKARYFPVLNEISAGTPKIYILAPLSYPDLTAPEISIVVWLIDAKTGDQIPLKGIILRRNPNPSGDSLFAEIALGSAKSGGYRFYMQVTAIGSGAITYTQVPLWIK